MRYKDWNIEAMTGYKPKTTFYMDFSIADAFGIQAIKQTYNSGMKNAMFLGVEYLTELVMVLNWKISEHYETRPALAELYQELWEKAENYCYDHLKGDDLKYFMKTID